jgi:PAS domain S-box-containing protein
VTEAPNVRSNLRAAVTAVRGAVGEQRRLREVFDGTPIPMVMVDGERRYLDGNGPARLMFRINLEELRGYRVDDLTPPHMTGVLDQIWTRLLTTGWISGSYDVAGPDGSRFEVAYYALANVLPGVHLGAFTLADWPDDELNVLEADADDPAIPLTPREIEVLTLAARGYSGPQIARQLVLSPATVKNHFAHIHAKLGVRSRAAAVAKAMQLGVIA